MALLQQQQQQFPQISSFPASIINTNNQSIATKAKVKFFKLILCSPVIRLGQK